MKPARILLIVVALVAGGLAAFLATRGGDPEPQTVEVTEVQQEPRVQVLVARSAIGLGQRVAADDVQWQDWPEGAVRPEYVTRTAVPDAPELLTGAVARFEIFAGEPIREAKLVNSDRGYMSAIIPEGMRAVSVPVTPESASGGFITPNDRVDVVLTRSGSRYSETILNNVRVLAIGARLGELGETGGGEDPDEPAGQRFAKDDIATLELTPHQAEVLLNATSAGRLALVLRSVADFNDPATGLATPGSAQAQAIKLIRHGNEQSVVSTVVSQPTQTAQAEPAETASEPWPYYDVFLDSISPSGPEAPDAGDAGAEAGSQ
ncbi:Flp pilus assembly protein CpaB [Pelagibacterium xiamenense]|uniref:Flp pilus assembly protein CpaB n=1 Tax=Pelagibacterium xiamenense TaxID=2901140 RepID=UPI001E303C70|nr:Flp pilus assembly protein CpaB [Pelagibacterium xiamenense]MCD7058870.1 Flp pilus assembly protein CpaB [Pelagibacterium xiamenense]